MKEINLFIEKLTLRVLFFKLIPFLVKNNKNKIQMFIIDFNPVAWKGLTFLEQFFDFKKSIFNFKLIDVKDENNLLLRLRIAFKDLYDIQNLIFNERVFQEFFETDDLSHQFKEYIKKTFSNVLIVNPKTIGRALYLIQLAVWKNRHLGSDAKVALILGTKAWAQPLKIYADKYKVTLLVVKDFSILPFISFFSFQFILTIRGIVSNRWEDLKNASYRKGLLTWFLSSTPYLKPKEPLVAMEYYGHLNSNNPEIYSDVFMWQYSKQFRNYAAVLYGIPSSPLDSKKKSEMKLTGLRPIVLRPDATLSFEYPIYNLRRVMPKLFFSFGNFFSPEWQDLKNKKAAYLYAVENWKRIFSEQNIKIYLSWFKYDQSHVAIADAIHENGGICALYQRAYDAMPSSEMSIFADLFFGFSKQAAELEAACGSNIPYFVVTGYLGDHRFELLKSKSYELRTKLEKNGAKKIFCFFDEGSAVDARWHTGHGVQRDGYEFCLRLILDNPDYGVIFKPKIPKTLRARLGPIGNLLKEAEKTGRCIVLEGGDLHGSFPPALAALASDFVIHSCLAAATAGLEAALAGKPTILVDIEGWSISPMYRLGVGKVVFTSWSQVSRGLDQFYLGDKSIGNWEKFIDEFDHFRDGKASQRMAEFLDDVYDQLKAGCSKEESLSFAAQKYGEKWGFENVFKIEKGKAVSMKELNLAQSVQ